MYTKNEDSPIKMKRQTAWLAWPFCVVFVVVVTSCCCRFCCCSVFNLRSARSIRRTFRRFSFSHDIRHCQHWIPFPIPTVHCALVCVSHFLCWALGYVHIRVWGSFCDCVRDERFNHTRTKPKATILKNISIQPLQSVYSKVKS